MRICCIDTETTGLEPETNYVVDFCIRTLYDQPDTMPNDSMVWRVRPPISMPEIAGKTHGITDDMLRDHPLLDKTLAAVWAEWIERYDAIVGYNPDYDIAMLQTEFKRHGVECKWPKIVVCCKRMWDAAEPPPSRALQFAYKKFVDEAGFEGAHGAAADVDATIRVFNAARAHYGLQEKTLSELDPKRALWCGPTDHLLWADSTKTALICNFGKDHRGKNLGDVDFGMLKWIMGKDFPEHVKRTVKYLMSISQLSNKNELVATYARERDT